MKSDLFCIGKSEKQTQELIPQCLKGKRGKKPVKYRKLLFKFTATTTGSDSRESIRK